MIANNYYNCSKCGNTINIGDSCDMCGCGGDKEIDEAIMNGKLAWDCDAECLIEVPKGWNLNTLYGKESSKYVPHVHILLTEDMIKDLVTEGRAMIVLPDGANVELKYTGPKIIDFQIHEVNIESVNEI